MQAQKISISLSKELTQFLKNYQQLHHLKTRSEVVGRALYLLQQAQLEVCYKEANQEIQDDFEITNLDGLDENETW